MEPDEARAMARAIFGTNKPRSPELRSWLRDGVMSASQAARLGTRSKPACFASEQQWVSWCIHEAQRRVPSSGYCYDCTAAHKARMLHNNLCHHPLTFFIIVGHSDEAVEVGQHPSARRRPPRR
jgi:hypothetical protein